MLHMWNRLWHNPMSKHNFLLPCLLMNCLFFKAKVISMKRTNTCTLLFMKQNIWLGRIDDDATFLHDSIDPYAFFLPLQPWGMIMFYWIIRIELSGKAIENQQTQKFRRLPVIFTLYEWNTLPDEKKRKKEKKHENI